MPTKKRSRNLSATGPVATEIKLETLQAISFELIGKSVTLWRTYKDDDKSKGIKISKGMEIHDRVVAAMRYHPDIVHLHELAKVEEEVRTELANARKIHRITELPPGTEQETTA